MKDFIISKANNVPKIGVIILPSRSTNLLGFNDSRTVKTIKTVENKNRMRLPELVESRIGAMETSYTTDVVLGMTYIGPSVRSEERRVGKRV